MTQSQAPAQAPLVKPGLDAAAAAILVGCCVIWGAGLVMVKIANGGISPVLNSGLRSVAAGIVLFAWTRLRGITLFSRDGTLVAGIVCGVVFALEFLTLYEGVARTQASRAIIFLNCAPFVAAIGEHFLVPGHKLTKLRIAGLVAAFAGLGVALSERLLDGSGAAGATLAGDILCLMAGIFWGLTTVIVKTTPLRSAPAEKTMLYQLGVSAVVLVPASYLMGEAGVTSADPKVWLAFAYTVLLVVVLGYTTWFWLMRRYSAASLHAFTFLTPIFGVIAGHFILGERFGWPVVAGLALVALGIWMVNMPGRAQPKPG